MWLTLKLKILFTYLRFFRLGGLIVFDSTLTITWHRIIEPKGLIFLFLGAMWHVVGCWMCLYDYVDYDYNYKGHFYTIANDFYNYTMYMICGKFDMDV